MPKQKILITGGAGMIGKALIRILYKNYYLIVLDKKSQIKRNKKYIKSFKNKGVPIEAWIYKIAHNITVDYYRKKKYPTINLEDVINMESYNNTEKKVLENLDKEEIKSALSKLSSLQQQVIQLRLVSGLRSKEVALIMEKSDGAIRELQRSGLKTLREILYTNNIFITEDSGR